MQKASRTAVEKMPDFSRERDLGGRIAGVDEAGRGPLAGPVVAAAVLFPDAGPDPDLAALIDDSKKMSARRREAAIDHIQASVQWAVGIATVDEIDTQNILQATFTAMRRAVYALAPPPDAVLVDGNRAPLMDIPAYPVVKGDALSLSIAAASIIAKVTRDRIMVQLASKFPAYGWERNAGYGVKAHIEALNRYGPTPHHRRSFAPVRNLLGPQSVAPQ